MKIITTHLHADFDCVASMVAAKKLYPDAELVFPGSQEKNVRDFLSETEYPLQYRRLKGLDLGKIEQVIVVDASTRERVGMFSELADNKNVRFHLYDHHPLSKVDIPFESAEIRERGSTATIFVELFRERGIDISPQEATLMALGIYEDTGSLTFSSTSPEDYEAAAWLLKRGADLNVISRYISRELSAAQVDMLNMLLKSLEFRNIEGVKVALATASTPRYLGDIAMLAHKIMDIENIYVLFILVRMEDRIHLVARSRIESVNVAEVAEQFGGGGHPTAASATIKNLTMPQTVDKFWEAATKAVEPAPVASDMMVEHVITVNIDSTINEAEALLTRFDINGMPVVNEGRPVGLIMRQIVEKAIFHGMAENKVGDFMISEYATVNPDTKASVLESIMLEHRQKLAPVVEKDTGKLLGLITRGMVLQKLYKDSLKKPGTQIKHERGRRTPITKNMDDMMRKRLPESIIKLFNIVTDVANKNGYPVYVVGGFVRDLLLNIPNMDVDIVVEGDGIDFAHKLTARLGGYAQTHEKFKTAVVVLPDGSKVDVATARIEYYAHPAALPTVEMSAIRHDLYRRDFSINAMAIRLNGSRPNTLLDFFGGQEDIKSRSIRVLHNLSFVEDPTRAFRAVRFESRFGFSLGKQTLALLGTAVRSQMFNRLSSSRLFAELKLIFKEKRPARSLSRMKELDLLRFIHPAMDFNDSNANVMDRAESLIAWYELTFPGAKLDAWLIRMLAAITNLTDKQVMEIGVDSPSIRKTVDVILECRSYTTKALKELAKSNNTMTPSKTYEL
ncbi:tRNA nucleotidyltransferase, A-adding, partial [hydrothermal vent metagenome]